MKKQIKLLIKSDANAEKVDSMMKGLEGLGVLDDKGFITYDDCDKELEKKITKVLDDSLL